MLHGMYEWMLVAEGMISPLMLHSPLLVTDLSVVTFYRPTSSILHDSKDLLDLLDTRPISQYRLL